MAYSPPATGQGDDPTPSGPRRPPRPGSTPPSLPSELPFLMATGWRIRPTPSEGSRASGVHTPFGTPPSQISEMPIHPETAESSRPHPSEWWSASRIRTGRRFPPALSTCGSGAAWPLGPCALVTALPSPTPPFPPYPIPSFPSPPLRHSPVVGNPGVGVPLTLSGVEEPAPCEGGGTHPSGTTTCDLATPLDPFPSFRPSSRNPSPRMGVRVPFRPLRHAKSPEIPLGVVQSN